MTKIKHGDFSDLAQNYSLYRPGYSSSVLNALLGYAGKNDIDCVDVGAGTGIWTRMLAQQTKRPLIAIEPNHNMRQQGEKDSVGLPIEWKDGNGENTHLNQESCDWVSMASSFDWVDFEKGLNEFHRILRPNGVFTALWNPRFLEKDPFLLDIENHLKTLVPNLSRVSSGSSDFVNTLTNKLQDTPLFKDMIYIEGYHTQQFTKESYVGVWESVNDVRYQAGEDKFKQFIDYIKNKIKEFVFIDVTYKTRAWIVRKA